MNAEQLFTRLPSPVSGRRPARHRQSSAVDPNPCPEMSKGSILPIFPRANVQTFLPSNIQSSIFNLPNFQPPREGRHMNADQLTNPRSDVLTACPERSEGFKRSNAPTFHPSVLPSSDCSSTLKIQKQFNSNAQIPSFVPRKGNSKNQLRNKC
jgi:hypothetical protein